MSRRLSRPATIYILLATVVFGSLVLLVGRVLGPSLDMVTDGATEPGRAAMGQLGCLSCHALAGQGGNLGPELGSELAARGMPWIHDYLTSGDHIDVYPGNGHQAFTLLNEEQGRLLAEYLSELSISAQYQGPRGTP